MLWIEPLLGGGCGDHASLACMLRNSSTILLAYAATITR
jgi:hypothetical protein